MFDCLRIPFLGPKNVKKIKDNVNEKSALVDLSGMESQEEKKPGFFQKMRIYKPALHLGIACLICYMVGYLQYTVYLVMTPIVIFIGYLNRKDKKKQKSILASDILNMGEEKALKCRFSELPSWVQFSEVERVEWINAMIGMMWPHVTFYLNRFLHKSIEPLVREHLEQYKLWGFKFQQIDLGRIPPRFGGVKIHGTPQTKTSEIIFDLDFEYNGDVNVSISVLKISASMSDVLINGKLRIVLKPLIEDIPFIAGIQIYFLVPPQVDFDLGGAASIMDLPGLNGILKDVINDYIEKSMVLPNKINIMLSNSISPLELKMPQPIGILTVDVLEARDLPSNMDVISTLDPYIIVRHGSFELHTSVKTGPNPIWNEKLVFPIEVTESQDLVLMLFDRDEGSSDDFCGSLKIDTQCVIKNGQIDTWASLENAIGGQVHLKLSWSPVKGPGEGDCFDRSALLCIFLDSIKVSGRCSSRTNLRTKIKCVDQIQNAQNLFNGEKGEIKFHEGFVFILDTYNENSKLKFSILDDQEEAIVASGNFIVSKIISDLNIEQLKLSTFKLNDGETTITFAAQLRFLDKQFISKFSDSVSTLITAGSKKIAKGLGIGAYGAAKEVSGYARNVGSATGTAFRHIGNAASKSKRRMMPSGMRRKTIGDLKEISDPASMYSIRENDFANDQESKPPIYMNHLKPRRSIGEQFKHFIRPL